jgi:hypothetical protein
VRPAAHVKSPANKMTSDRLTMFRHGLMLIIGLLAAAALVASVVLTGRPVAAPSGHHGDAPSFAPGTES